MSGSYAHLADRHLVRFRKYPHYARPALYALAVWRPAETRERKSSTTSANSSGRSICGMCPVFENTYDSARGNAAAAPRLMAARTPLASAMPPAAITGIAIASAICGISAKLPVRELSAERKNEPR